MDIDDAFTIRFVNAFRATKKAVLAMRVAGYNGTDEAAQLEAEKLLRLPAVQQLVTGAPLFPYELHDVLMETAAIAFAPWRDFVKIQMNKDGEVVNAILNLDAKERALKSLGEYFGAWGNRRSRTIKNTKDFAERIAEELKRVHGPQPEPTKDTRLN